MSCQPKWPCGSRYGSSAARLLGLWFRIAPGARMSVSCDCCVLSGRGLCDGSIAHHEEYYRVCDVSQCDLGVSTKTTRPTKAVEPYINLCA